MTARISILGLYNYDPTLFAELSLPEGLDKQILIDNLTIELADLEVVYPRADLMKAAIKSWSAKMLKSWERAFKAIMKEYNPLDTFEKRFEGADQIIHDLTYIDKYEPKLKTVSQDEGTDSSLDSVAAFDSSDLEAKNKTSTDYGRKTTTEDTGESITKRDDDGTITHSYDSSQSGRIGTHTPQSLLKAEIEFAKNNMYDIIIDDFKNRFCLLVYF